MQNDTLKGHKPAGLTASVLKTIAIVAMAVDHIAFAFVPEYYGPLGAALHFIGRTTAPIMFYFLVEGYHHTRSKNKYTLRLFVFAVVSYLPFVYFHAGTGLGQWPPAASFASLNVGYTLLLAFLALRARHQLTNPIAKALVIALLFLLSPLGDWGYLALIFVLVFDVFRGNFKHQAWAYSAVVLTQLMPNVSAAVRLFASGAGSATMYGPYFSAAFVQLGMFVPLLLLGLYNGQKGGGGKAAKWGFYVFYPLHLLLIVVLKGTV
ncbi:conjugal transfer protein TraX [Ruminococcaceae bacterium OttesenSCG-928-A16]|nr:conjugal transfer protein TraX [Ruminococcaceae bacterium OttesenSCG-928-A16]